MLNSLIVFICLLNLYLIANAISDGMKDIGRWDHAIKQVESVKVVAEKSCGLNIDFSFDTETFMTGTKLSEFDNKGMSVYCGDTFAAIYDLCLNANYRKALTHVKSASCAFDNNITKPDAKLEQGHLQLTFNWETSNHRKTIKEYLIRIL